jgi:lysophospholipase L1-like esterase
MRGVSFRRRRSFLVAALVLAATLPTSLVVSRLIAASDEPLAEVGVPEPPRSRIPTRGAINLLVLGSSLSARSDWPEDLRDRLEERLKDCAPAGVELRVIGKGGADSAWGLAQLSAGLDFRPDVVLIEFTINDADIRNRMSRGESERNHGRIIDMLKETHPEAAIYLLRLNRAHGPRALLRPSLARYERLLPEIARRLSVGFVDLRAEWSDRWKNDGYRSLPDGLHPTDAAAREVNVARILSIVGGVLQADC